MAKHRTLADRKKMIKEHSMMMSEEEISKRFGGTKTEEMMPSKSRRAEIRARRKMGKKKMSMGE